MIYKIYAIIAETRMIQVLKGLSVIVIAFWIAKLLKLKTFLWLLERGLEVAAVALIILFQPEMRRILIKLGDNRLFGFFMIKEKARYLDRIADALESLSKRRIGALIVFERNAGLKTFIETGTEIDAVITTELITTIFMPATALHDGALILQNERISAAGCFLPITERTDIEKNLGSRHRAALGLAEQTDAVIIIVSEENGNVSIATDGKLHYGLTISEIRKNLEELIIKEKPGIK
jgi:diadenylate cyclase